MYAVAIIGDILSLVPGLNIATGLITGGLLWIVGEATGENIFSTSRIGGTLLAFLVEEIPIFSIFPAWTLRVYLAKKDTAESEG